MAVVLALGATLSFGSGDFIAGLVSRRVAPITVATFTHWLGLALLLAAIPLVGVADPRSADFAWGAAAGVGSGGGVAFFYLALSRGRMSVVAPVTAVVAAVLPVLAGVALGDRPGLVGWVGIVVAVAAVTIVTSVPEPGASDTFGKDGVPSASASPIPLRRRLAAEKVPAAFAAGAGFGVFSICLDQTTNNAGLWPLVGGRVAGGIGLAVVAAALGLAWVPASGSRRAASIAGALEVLAAVLLLLAFRRGLLSLVSAVLAVYPAVTVVLARLVLGERLHRLQLVGLARAIAGVAMIALA